jgi:hypothetical protein
MTPLPHSPEKAPAGPVETRTTITDTRTMEEDANKGFTQLAPDYFTKRDAYGWTLREWRDGTGKDGEPTRTHRDTYHGTIEQVCRTVLDREAGSGESPKAIVAAVEKAQKAITHAILTSFK